MTGTNPVEEAEKPTDVADDDKPVTEDDLRSLKYDNDEVEPAKAEDDSSEEEKEDEKESEDKGEEDAKAEDSKEEEEQSDDESEEVDTSFVKEFPNIKGDTPEEYAKNLEEAYKNSTAEAMRLKGLAEKGKPKEEEPEGEKPAPSNYLEMYAQQKLDDDITKSYAAFKIDYPQVDDDTEYAKFTRTVETLTNTIMTSESRVAPPSELYSKAAVILGWEKQSAPTDKEKLAMAVKDKTGTSKTSSSGKKGVSKSKVTDAMIAVNRAMYPGKTDAQIREELEPYVN